ncbi:MAG: PAS domain S-box protein, partial [Chloroflexales bacterium]
MDSHSRMGDDPFALPAVDGPSAQASPTSVTHERTLQEICAHTPILISVAAIHTDDLTLVTLNPTFAHLFGATPADLQGQTLRDLAVDRDNVENLLAHAWQAWDTGAPVQAEIAWQSPASLRRIHVTIAPILAPGMPPCCSIMGMDITAHPPAHPQVVVPQYDLAYRLAAATSLEEALPICLDIALRSQMDCGGIYLVDPASGDLHLAYTRGLSPAFVESARFIPAQSNRAQMVHTGQSQYLDYGRDLAPDQDVVRENVRMVAMLPLMYQGRVIGCFNLASSRYTAAEVSPPARMSLEVIAAQVGHVIVRLQAEAALRESNAYLESLIDYANAPIVVWDSQFRITRFNHAFELLSGYAEAEMIGQSLAALFPPALAERSMALIHGTMLGERWEAVEIKILHRDGTVRTVLWNSATLVGPDGQTPTATIAQGQDITARAHAEAALHTSESRLRTILQTALDGFLILDRQMRIIEVNDVYCAMS